MSQILGIVFCLQSYPAISRVNFHSYHTSLPSQPEHGQVVANQMQDGGIVTMLLKSPSVAAILFPKPFCFP